MKPILGLALAGLLALTACTNDKQSVGSMVQFSNIVRDQALARKAVKARAATSTALTVTRDQLAGISAPLTRVRIEKTNTFSLLYVAQEKEGHRIWFSPDNVSLAMRAGVIDATRGLGHDLFAVEAPGLFARLSTRVTTGSYTRIHSVLDGSNHIVKQAYTCRIIDKGPETVVILDRGHATRHLVETCEGPAGTFANDYWQGASDRAMWVSRQWLGPEIGHLFLERLIE
ncbi:YjbF family lipoprotein [Paracoccaceae bacterium Fryx2]|nr:YjbF family lipoprotein [Paracoccaceae bacterium Fryx2]